MTLASSPSVWPAISRSAPRMPSASAAWSHAARRSGLPAPGRGPIASVVGVERRTARGTRRPRRPAPATPSAASGSAGTGPSRSAQAGGAAAASSASCAARSSIASASRADVLAHRRRQGRGLRGPVEVASGARRPRPRPHAPRGPRLVAGDPREPARRDSGGLPQSTPRCRARAGDTRASEQTAHVAPARAQRSAAAGTGCCSPRPRRPGRRAPPPASRRASRGTAPRRRRR